jgi:hypothetical protein
MCIADDDDDDNRGIFESSTPTAWNVVGSLLLTCFLILSCFLNNFSYLRVGSSWKCHFWIDLQERISRNLKLAFVNVKLTSQLMTQASLGMFHDRLGFPNIRKRPAPPSLFFFLVTRCLATIGPQCALSSAVASAMLCQLLRVRSYFSCCESARGGVYNIYKSKSMEVY